MRHHSEIEEGFSRIFETACEFNGDPVAEKTGAFADFERLFKIVGESFFIDERIGGIFCETEIGYVTAVSIVGEFWEARSDLIDIFIGEDHRGEIGFGEVAVVIGGFFAPHEDGLFLFGIPAVGSWRDQLERIAMWVVEVESNLAGNF
jgi:hypothetical protein